jgi:hypothetical protein
MNFGPPDMGDASGMEVLVRRAEVLAGRGKCTEETSHSELLLFVDAAIALLDASATMATKNDANFIVESSRRYDGLEEWVSGDGKEGMRSI